MFWEVSEVFKGVLGVLQEVPVVWNEGSSILGKVLERTFGSPNKTTGSFRDH